MKFVFFGYDFSFPALARLIADGHQCIGVQSFACDNIFNFNTKLLDYAQQNKIPTSMEAPDINTIDGFVNAGAEVFISAGYPFKLPCVHEARAYMMNLHPSLLPVGRGIMPTPHILLHTPEASGLTLHKMTQKFDAGDIIAQIPLPLHEREDVETLSARCAMAAPELLSKVMADLPRFWKDAKPQDESKAVYWREPGEEMRALDWSKNVADIAKTGRAFGRYGSIARIEERNYGVFDFAVWKEKHLLEPGTVALRMSREIIVAAQDGFVCLKDFAEMA